MNAQHELKIVGVHYAVNPNYQEMEPSSEMEERTIEVLKNLKLVSAMTCLECGIPMQQVDKEAIFQGYRLAFPENQAELDAYFIARDEYFGWSPFA